MSILSQNKRVEVVTETPVLGHPIRRFVLTLSLLVGVLYVGVYFACQTDGFRSYMEEFLENQLGIPVEVKGSRVQPNLDLVVTDVMTRGSSRQGVPGYKIQEAVVRWSVLNKIRASGQILSSLELKNCSVSFVLGKGGAWQPAALAPFGSQIAKWCRFHLSESSATTAVNSDQPMKKPWPIDFTDFWDHLGLSVENGDISWWDVNQEELAFATGIRFNRTPLILPNRKMTHYFLTLDYAGMGNQQLVRNVIFEMLKMESNSVILTCVGDWEAEKADERRVILDSGSR